jgi:hypothetical protein
VLFDLYNSESGNKEKAANSSQRRTVIREAIMNDSRPDPAQLQTRFHMLDLLAGVILPACVTSAWPVERPEQRLAVFFPALGLGICSAWWTATLIHTLKIRGGLWRTGLHIYAYTALISFSVFLISGFQLLANENWLGIPRGHWIGFITNLLTAPFAISVFYFESVRRKVEKTFIDEAHGGPPLDANAQAAGRSLKQLLQAKKQDT